MCSVPNFNSSREFRNKQVEMRTKIVDMNEDCIGEILKLLNFDELLNVAESNARLRNSAKSVIRRRHRNLQLVIKIPKYEKFNRHRGHKLHKDEIHTIGIHSTLKSMRCFGSVCRKIVIDYYKMSLVHKKLIESYLLKHCSDEGSLLTDVVLESCGKSALRFIEKPLRNIQNVTMSDDTELDFEQLNRKFPNMKSLKLEWTQIRDGKCIERKFPALKQLQIEIGDRSNHFSQKNVQNMIKKNPQLNHLIVALHQHPELNEIGFVNFLRKDFEAPGKIFHIIHPNL